MNSAKPVKRTFKIGAMVESFRLGLDKGLEAAAKVGADGVQIYATSGEMHPDALKGPARAKLAERVRSLGLEISALCGDFGGHGFQMAEHNRKRIDDSRRVMDLAVELGCHVVTTHIGVVPADAKHPRYKIMAKACEELGRHGEQVGAAFAIETGPEPAKVLKTFLDDIGMPKGIGVNFDPANLVMVCLEDIPAAVALLGRYIVHTHAKDGVNLKPVDPEMLYGSFAKPVEGFKWTDYIKEVPLGQGGVNFPTYLAALRNAGFSGYLTIEREVGDNPQRDIAEAVRFLKDNIAKLG
jgi:sugar phosphate isomerase/epimerase